MNKPRISTPALEGQFQAAKWVKIQALVDETELALLFQEPFFIYPLSGTFPLNAFPMKKETYLEIYKSWVDALKLGKVPKENRDINAVAWTPSSDALWLQQIPGQRYMIKPCQPFVQVQVHQMGYSDIDHEFRPMILSQNSIFWGLQFSFPQIYQDPKTMDLKKSEDSKLFQAIRQWIRNYTLPTPMLVHHDRPRTLNLDSARQSQIEAQRSERGSPFPEGKGDEKDRFGDVAASPNSKFLAGRGTNNKRVNIPIRLGKKCFSWINNHPQLQNKGLSVLELANGN